MAGRRRGQLFRDRAAVEANLLFYCLCNLHQVAAISMSRLMPSTAFYLKFMNLLPSYELPSPSLC